MALGIAIHVGAGRDVENAVRAANGTFGRQPHQPHQPTNDKTATQKIAHLVMTHLVYTDETVLDIRSHFAASMIALQELQIQCLRLSHDAKQPRVREYLTYGVGRRLNVLRNSLRNIFMYFPLETKEPLPSDDLTDAQVNLHAFVINLSGVLDNFAWLYLLRHDLERQIGGRRNVGLFISKTTRHFPEPIKRYLATSGIANWYGQYVKNYRDALAHRIAIYIPPAVWTQAEGDRYNELHREIVASFQSGNLERVEELRRQQYGIGKPCFYFLHSFSPDEKPQPVMLHPQVIADAETVIEFGKVFFRYWDEAPQAGPAWPRG